MFSVMDSMIWSLVRFLSGENQKYGVTVWQRMIQGYFFYFNSSYYFFFKSFEFRAKNKYYKCIEREGRTSEPS